MDHLRNWALPVGLAATQIALWPGLPLLLGQPVGRPHLVTITGVPAATGGVVEAGLRARVGALGGRMAVPEVGRLEVMLPAPYRGGGPIAVRVMIVDDQPVVRAGFAAIVDSEPGLSVVGEAADGAAAVELAPQVAPDVVLMDVRMPRMDGIAATRLLTAGSDRIRVLVLTTFNLDEYVFEALRAGASGFLLKTAEPAELTAGIRVVAAGEGMLAPVVTRRLIDAFAAGAVSSPRPADPGTAGGSLAALTPRENQVLALVAGGLSNAEIGAALGVATGTVKAHVNALLAKLGVRDRVQATILAYDLGLARPRGADT